MEFWSGDSSSSYEMQGCCAAVGLPKVPPSVLTVLSCGAMTLQEVEKQNPALELKTVCCVGEGLMPEEEN